MKKVNVKAFSNATESRIMSIDFMWYPLAIFVAMLYEMYNIQYLIAELNTKCLIKKFPFFYNHS